MTNFAREATENGFCTLKGILGSTGGTKPRERSRASTQPPKFPNNRTAAASDNRAVNYFLNCVQKILVEEMALAGRGTRFDPTNVIALKEGSFANNLWSAIEEKATPSQDTIDARNALAKKGTVETQLKCSQILLEIEKCSVQIRVLSKQRPRNEFLIKQNLRRKKLLQGRLNQLQPIADNLEHTGGSVDSAKVVMKAVETSKLYHDNLQLYNEAVDEDDASYLTTDIADQIKRTSNGGSIMGQTIDSEQDAVEKDLEDDFEAAIDAEFEEMFPKDVLKPSKEGANGHSEQRSGSPGRRRPNKVLVAEGGAVSSGRRGGGEVTVVAKLRSQKGNNKKAKDPTVDADEDRESTPSPRARMSANHSPRSNEDEPSDVSRLALSLPSLPENTYSRTNSRNRLNMSRSDLDTVREEEETSSTGRRKKKTKKSSNGHDKLQSDARWLKRNKTMTEEEFDDELYEELLREDL